MKRTFLLWGLVVISLFYAAGAMAFENSPIGWASYDTVANPDPCHTPALNGTTGSAGGPVHTVTNEADFATYASSTTPGPLTVQVEGTINLTARVDISPNKTIIGIGTDPTINGPYNLRIRGQDSGGNPRGYNIIVRNLILRNHTAEDKDGLTIQDQAHHVWVDHCDFTANSDGAVDITHACNYITISWNHFYNQDKTCLLGHSKDNADEDTGHFKVTYHHNFFDGTDQRHPRARFSFLCHVYNNFYNAVTSYGIASTCDAYVLAEGNYFKNVANPMFSIGYSDDPDGWLIERDNIYDNSGTPEVNPPAFMPEPSTYYSYTLDDTEDIPTTVELGAGVDGMYAPHWYFTVYGDFDRSNKVDTNDLGQFVDYWLDTNDIDDADYYDDGVVNGREFGLFASNWMKIPPDTTAPDAPADLWASAGDGTVSLDWADNNEPDFDGYNLYRSTTSGSFDTKLNSSLLTDSNYTDDAVTNSTMYYYVVTAVDTNENESSNSSEACAVPSSDGNSITIQENATGFCDVDGIIDTKHAGYTGPGFCDTENASSQGIDWSINIPSADTYTFKWRYAHGKTDDRSARLLVNGSPVISSIAFPPTGAWTTWDTVSVDVSMTAGIKDIRLEGTTSNSLANIDYLMVIGSDPEVASCP